MTDWNRYRKCEAVCAAETGQACVDKTGVKTLDGSLVHLRVTREEPHSGRKLRTGGAR